MAWTFYGDWGGPGWSNGKFTEPGEEIDYTGDFKDVVDKQFRDHDQAYDTAEKNYAASDKTELDRALYWAEIIKADNAVRDGLNDLRTSGELGGVGSPLYGVAAQADAAFAAKNFFYNYPAYKSGRDPLNQDTDLTTTWYAEGWGGIPDSTNRDFNRGTAWTRPRDPLVLDLGGNGIDLTATSSAVLFDHNADGIKTGTQWVKASDALLVRDLDGNGLIDSGRELFGDQTLIQKQYSYFDPNLNNGSGGMATFTRTQTAANGFEALRPLDIDSAGASDGQIDASDTAYASLQVWQDLNQDGISQANELRTLAQAGIGSIALNKQITVTDANGQTQQITQRATVRGISRLTKKTKKNCKSICYRKRSAIRPFDIDIGLKNYKNLSSRPLLPKISIYQVGDRLWSV